MLGLTRMKHACNGSRIPFTGMERTLRYTLHARGGLNSSHWLRNRRHYSSTTALRSEPSRTPDDLHSTLNTAGTSHYPGIEDMYCDSLGVALK